MKLLIVTQVLDKHHPILGFFHRWVEEFAKHCEHVHVICLQKGEYTLPDNVTVYSLGKEAGKSKIGYLTTFYKLIWKLRHEYDSVFVHMNQIYVILGAPFWRAQRKKIGLWYAHGSVPRSLKFAVTLSDKVFTSTEEGLRIDTPKRVLVGQGIDTDNFKEISKTPSDTLRIITVGRIAQSKNIETLLTACARLKEANIQFHFTIVGVPITEAEHLYDINMKSLTAYFGLIDNVRWAGPVSNHQLPTVLQQSDIFIHDGSTNSLDKALLEAVLCGCVVVSSNPAYKTLTHELAPEYLFTLKDEKKLADIIKKYHQYTEKMLKVKSMVKEEFTISNLISGIVSQY